jgi:hypothetical protein
MFVDFKSTVLSWLNDPCLELEIRLGKYDRSTRSFQSGVSVEYWYEIRHAIEQCIVKQLPGWVSSPEERFTYMYFTLPDERHPIRARYDDGVCTEVVELVSGENVIYQAQGMNHPCDARIATKREIIRKKNIVVGRKANWVRLVVRTTAIHKNRIRYDLSKVQSGKTRQQACLSDPVYMIESEFIHCREQDQELLATLDDTQVHSLWNKLQLAICDLLVCKAFPVRLKPSNLSMIKR